MAELVISNLLLFVVSLCTAWGMGGVVLGGATEGNGWGRAATRMAIGLALLGFGFGLLGLAGALNRVGSGALCAFGIVLAFRSRDQLASAPRSFSALAIAVPGSLLGMSFVLALYPPVAFDETLYHLPTVERFASEGSLPFITELRAPVFPHLDEVLRVPLLLFGSDVSTHLLSLAATLVTTLVVLAWASEAGGELSGIVAAALFVSAPIVIHLAACGYVEALLTMFVATSFYALERWSRGHDAAWLAAAAILAGSAAGTKYLGLFWAAVLGVLVFARSQPDRRLRNAAAFGAIALLAMAPWYGRILAHTGNPLFPFLGSIFGSSIWDGLQPPDRSAADRLVAMARLPWDVVVSRGRVNQQPPFSPALVLLLPLALRRACDDRFVRNLLAIGLAWVVVWSFLPPDSRYLVPVLPLAAVACAVAMSRWVAPGNAARPLVSVPFVIAILLPGLLYGGYRITMGGAIPTSAATREEWLHRKNPEYRGVSFLNAHARANDIAYVCGGEQLAYHFRGRMIGDHTGPARYDRIVSAPDTAELADRFDSLGARWVIVVRERCRIPALEQDGAARTFVKRYDDGITVVYEMQHRNEEAEHDGSAPSKPAGVQPPA